MKLSEWAKKQGITYRTAWNHYKSGNIPNAYQLKTGTIIVPEPTDDFRNEYVVCYARVSSSQNEKNLSSQADRIIQYANAKGYQIKEVIKEIGSGLNDKRPKLIKLITSEKPTVIIVEHTDILTRFGLNYIEVLLRKQNCRIEVVNSIDNDTQDLMQDFVSLVTSFCARLYGLRRCKRKTEKLIKELENEEI